MPVDGAPVLGPNPYVSAATSAGSAAMSLLNSLRAAHDQQLRLENQKRQQDAARQLQETNDYGKYLNEGAIPLDTPPDQNRPTILQTPQDPYGGHDPNRVVDLPGIGKRLYIPTTGEKEDAKQQSEVKYKGTNKARITAERAQEIQASGIQADSNTEYAPGLIGEMNAAAKEHDAKANRKPRTSVDTTNFRDGSGNPLPMLINEDEGTYRQLRPEEGSAAPGGIRADLDKAAGLDLFNTSGVHAQAGSDAPRFVGKEPTPKSPKSLHFHEATNDAGDVTTIARDPETGKVVTEDVRKGIGAKRKDPDAPVTKPGQAKPAQFVAVERDKQRRMAKAKEEYRKAIASQAGIAATDEERKAANETLKSTFQDIQNDYESSLRDLTGQDIQHNSWADDYGKSGGSSGSSGSKPAAQPAPKPAAKPAEPVKPAAAPAKPAAAPAKPAAKKYTAADVTAWAKAHGKDPADALRRAKKNGLL